MQRTKSIARWLISQRNENGGFQATSDTIVALQAMAEYMTWINNAQVPYIVMVILINMLLRQRETLCKG